jgi:hypothetical protein
MGHHHWSKPGVDDKYFYILDPAPVLYEHRIFVVGHLHQLVLMEKNGLPGCKGIRNACGLNLGAHHRPGAGSRKTAQFTGHLGSVARGRDY